MTNYLDKFCIAVCAYWIAITWSMKTKCFNMGSTNETRQTLHMPWRHIIKRSLWNLYNLLAGSPSSGRKVYENWAMHLIFIPHQTIPFLDLSLSVILLSFLDSLSILHEVNLLKFLHKLVMVHQWNYNVQLIIVSHTAPIWLCST